MPETDPTPVSDELRICMGCGSVQSMEALTAAGFIACCPERKMVGP